MISFSIDAAIHLAADAAASCGVPNRSFDAVHGSPSLRQNSNVHMLCGFRRALDEGDGFLRILFVRAEDTL